VVHADAVGDRDRRELARRAASLGDPRLGGLDLPFIETTPIIGFWIAASSSPIARMKARCGVRASPSRVMSDRSFLIASECLLYSRFHQAIIRDNGRTASCEYALSPRKRTADPPL